MTLRDTFIDSLCVVHDLVRRVLTAVFAMLCASPVLGQDAPTPHVARSPRARKVSHCFYIWVGAGQKEEAGVR